MNAELIFVGSELVSGKTVNTNASYISKKLQELGHNCYMQYVVDDNKARIVDTLTTALSKSNLVIVSGGLGPTADDITKEAVCEALGLELVENAKCKKHLEDYFARLGKTPTPNNFKQTTAPRDAIIFPNDKGTACGIGIEYGKRRIILLPGPPKELTYMFDSYVASYLKKSSAICVESQTLNVFGMGESAIETIIRPFCNLGNPSVATYCKENECDITVTATADTSESARLLCSNTTAQINTLLGDVVYGINSEGLAHETVNQLRKSGLKIATAESCTGGMLSEALTSVPHASDAVEIGILAYSNRIKNEALSVPLDVLLEEGAISAETAMYLAKNVRILSDADIGVGITGNAGPTASENKPVGLVYIAIADKTKYFIKKLELPASYGREKIRNYATLTALDLVRRYVLCRPASLEGMISFDEEFVFTKTENITSNSISEENFAVFEVDDNYIFESTLPLAEDNSNEYILDVDSADTPEKTEESKPNKFLCFLKRHWIKLTCALVLLALVISSALLIGNFVHENRQRTLILEARENFNFKLDEKSDETGIYKAFDPLIKQNSDVRAWVIVGSTNIDNPVYQAQDNKYYQNHNMVKEKSKYGALFFDCKNVISKEHTDQNLTIFGHKTTNKLMFGELDSYRSLSFYKSNSIVKLKTLYDEHEYVIFAVFVTNSDPKDDNGQVFNYTQSSFDSADELNAFVTEAKLRSLITVPVEIDTNDAILTLSTSSDEFDGARFVVMAKQVADGDVALSKNATLNSNAKYPQVYYDKNNLDGYNGDSAPTPSTPSSSEPTSSEPSSSEPSSSEPSSSDPSSSEPSSSNPSSSEPSSSDTSSSTPSTPVIPCEHEAPSEFETTEGPNHSFICTKCGETVTEVHSFVIEKVADAYVKSDATCTAPATYHKSCACGEVGTETSFTFGEPIDTAHEFEYEYDDEGHWGACKHGCGTQAEKTAHSYETDDKCVCGQEKPTDTATE